MPLVVRGAPVNVVRDRCFLTSPIANIVDQNGQIEMKVVWEDAPSDYKVKGKSIVGAEMDFTLQEFKESYTVYKHEKPIVVVWQCF